MWERLIDKAINKGMKNLNRSEFTSRVLNCERAMYKTAYCLLYNAADCQDAVQEAIFKAWSKKDSLRDEEAFEAWLMRILVNTCKSTLRARGRRGECALEDIYPAPPSTEGELLETVRGLEERHRLPVIMRYVNGYSATEISQILRMPYRTVLKRLREARIILKDAMKEGKA